MPARPFFPGQLGAMKPDIFGLHTQSLLSVAGETEGERKARVDTVKTGIRAAFNAAVDHLGEEQARKLFQDVLRKPRQRGASKHLAADRDQRLLAAYDERPHGETVAALARRLHEMKDAKKLGQSAEAIETQIGQLVKTRTKERRTKAREERRWRMAMRNEPPTLLEAIPWAIPSKK
jgi:hypothetical protein